MKTCVVLLAFCLIFSFSVIALPVNAQAPLNLTIRPDGSIEPDTDFVWLQRNGDTYTFIVDIFGTITVQRAGITIDGAGHTLQGDPKEVNLRGINLIGHGETFNAYSNVLVKNLRILNFPEGIRTPSNNNSFIGNCFENTRIHILGGSGEVNIIKNNVFVNSAVFVDYNRGGDDVITENNFFDSGILVDLADAPIVDRNYWSNYTVKYPNATEVEGLGIWDTPYIDDRYDWATYRSIDYHPLVNPVKDFEVPSFSLYPSATPNITIQPTNNSGSGLPQTEYLLTILAAVSIAIICIGLLVYYKKRRGNKKS